jgi:hypothetical protein
MDNSANSKERRNLLKLLDRLDAVDPKCLPTAIVGRWLHGDADARRKIEDSIDGLPKRKKAG